MTVPPLNQFIVFVMYECAGAHDAPYFFVGVALGGAEHSLAGPFQTKAAASAWIETQTTIAQAMASP
jgi:hypothetical protein